MVDALPKCDIILASPPCTAFSVQSISKHWNPDKTPKSYGALNGIAIIEHTVRLIEQANPKYWVIENPRGMMRNVEVLKQFPRSTVTYCQYGERRMKPTDLWHKMPEGFSFRPPCRKGDPCHEAAPRGSRTGTQASNDPAIKSLIPYELSLEVCLAVEKIERT
jgi:hypothetical protein